MDNLLQNKTSIVIAHRLSTVRNADCILVMKQGRMIATGSHEELYSSSEDYKKMVDLQSLS
jgi:subfamily B ATP-binding cassette protein MsbA